VAPPPKGLFHWKPSRDRARILHASCSKLSQAPPRAHRSDEETTMPAYAVFDVLEV